MTTDEQAELSALLIALGQRLAPTNEACARPEPADLLGFAAQRVLRQIVGARALLDAAANHAEFIIERTGD